ncbi:molecular chaperone TorD family protein [Gammaproteobacteria bacterium]|nr:molecular chaperone TorD family protein [Gammaproteobacteria bacterium]
MTDDLKNAADPISQEAKARGSMYRFLAAVYLHAPTEDMVQQTRNQSFVEDLVALISWRAATGLKEHTAALDPKEEILPLKQEYLDLFVVPAGRYVTPFEDVYRGIRRDGKQERGPLLGERAVAVKVAYREAGAQMDQACKELPTHIGVELSFMGFLCEREAVTIDERDEAGCSEVEQSTATNSNIYRQYQKNFLQQHLNNWFPQLNQAIQEKAKSHFYRGLAQLTEDFLAWDLSAPVSPLISEALARDQGGSLGLRVG